MVSAVSPWATDTFGRLNTPASDVVGARTAKALTELGVDTVWDLIRHVPRRYLSGTESSDLRDLPIGDSVAIVLHVHQCRRLTGRNGQARLEVTLVDDHRSTITATFFSRNPRHLTYWQNQLEKGVRGLFIGKVTEFNRVPQLAHPTFVMFDADGTIVGRDDPDTKLMVEQVSRSGLLGIYPQSARINTWQISQSQQLALGLLAGLSEPLPEWALQMADLPTLLQACTDVHLPVDLDAATRGIRRLRFDEALAMQVTMAYRRADAGHHRAHPCPPRIDGLLARLDAGLPFDLTPGQRQVGETIMADLSRPHPMQRLLQGEVGSGKTIVALRAMLAVVDAGHQAALLVPTEVLAGQHYQTITALLGEWGGGRVLGAPDGATEVVLLTASQPAQARKLALLKMASGEAGLVIGTHALLADRVQFADLGLVVVDEQHRFGVRQRSRLSQTDGVRPHELVMTATPIPRSVAMTVFGDLAVSSLTGIPSGRQGVQTTLVNTRDQPVWVERAWQRIVEEVRQGRQAFVVCPRISAADADLAEAATPSATVEQTVAELTGGPLAGLRVQGLHGRMSTEQKDAVMSGFVAGEVDVLVATTVIEVGIDVPNASVMVVLDADRFGISQLHQLRGRIGRGEHRGLCLLLSAVDQGSDAGVRLAAVASTTDGFELAELDLVQRREGNVLGESQSGSRSTLKLLRVIENSDEIAQARQIAERLVAQDPERTDPYLRDMVTMTERVSAGDWLERS